ncbi:MULTISPECIES: IS110 family transposase [Paraburkholderia]|uniref:IS110 family transposase n=1 Tax=Paraburkholderia podalyriae TaxID=1938811 RepID=A0ABR7Q2V8_9BURK|nr:IS110 family transposase [Paraburkholderia podalyriae]MBC8752897.1 IS110 family transposase [Paraburkholderia podalyriae]
MASISNAPVRHRTVGIDLAISAVQVAQIFDDGRAIGKPIRFRLTSTDLRRFVSAIKSGVSADTPITAVMEPTGMAWFPVANWLQRAGIKVIRVKGQRVKALRKYLSEHAKTDAADAHVLGAIPGFGGRGLDPVHVPGPEQHSLQRLTKQRHRYQELVCSARRRVLDLIRWACPALEPVLPDTVTQLTLAILGELFDPRKVVAMRRDVLARFLSRHASGNHPKSGPFIDSLVEKLKSAAEETIELHGDSVDFVALQFEVAQEVEHLRLWDRHVSAIEHEVEQIYQRVHPSNALRSIPGIGATLAPLLIGVLGYAKRFRNEDHIRGFCGMFPTRNSSGGLDKPGQRLTKSGSDRVKRALYIAADVARKIDPDLAAVYWRLMVNKGHHHKQAICAVATRLINRIYRVLKTGEPYVLRDREGNAITVQEGKRIVVERFTVPLEVRQSRRNQPMPEPA